MLAFLLLLLPMVLLVALYTEPGTRIVLQLADRLLPIGIEYKSGHVGQRLQLARLSFRNDDLRLNLRGVTMELRPGCIWNSTLCFRTLTVEKLTIDLLPETDEPAADGLATPLFFFPVAMQADKLVVGSLRVRWPGGEWRQATLTARVRIRESRVEVARARITDSRLLLLDTDDSQGPGDEATVLPQLDLPIDLVVKSVHLQRPVWDLYGATQQQDSIRLKGRWVGDSLSLSQLHVESSDYGSLSLQGSLRFSGDWPLQVQAKLALAPSVITNDLFSNDMELSATGDLASLALEASSSGPIALAMRGGVNVLQSDLPFAASLTATSDANVPLSDFIELSDPMAEVQVGFPVALSASGSFAEQAFDLRAVVSGLGYESLQVALTGHHATGQVTISELALRDPTGANEIHGSGEVLFSDQIAWSAALASSGVNVPTLNDAVAGRIAGNLQSSGTVQDDLWQVVIDALDIRGEVNGLPASVTGHAGLASGLRLLPSNLQADIYGASLDLQSAGDDAGPSHLALNVPDASVWLPDSKGQLQLSAEVSADRQRGSLKAQLHNLQWGSLKAAAGTVAGQYAVDDDNAFKLDVLLSDVEAGDLALNSLSLATHGNTARQSLSLVTAGDLEGELQFDGKNLGSQWRGKLAPGNLKTPYGKWELPGSVALAWAPDAQQLVVNPHCWQQERAQLCPGRWTLGEAGGGSVELHGDMKLFAGLVAPTVDIDGDLQVSIDASWNPADGVRVQGTSQTQGVTLTQHLEEGETATFGWDEGAANFEYTAHELRLDGDFHSDGRKVVGFELLLPAQRDKPIGGWIQLDQLQLAGFAPFLPTLSVLQGDINGRVALAGTIDRPLAQGEVKVSDGRIVVLGKPTELDALELTLELQGDSGALIGAGTLGGGPLTLEGRISMYPEPQLELEIAGQKHTILYPPSTELQLSEHLQLALTSGLLKLTGNIDVHKGVLEFEQLPEDSVAVSSAVVEVDIDGNVIRQHLPFDLVMDVKIHIEDHLRVTGSTLETTLRGDLQVLQRPGQPIQLFGNLNTVGGEVRAYQSRLEIKRGTISFSGPPDNPTLDVRAERRISSADVTVGVRLQGPLEEDLSLDIYSEPKMSQADAMSYLVRGRGMDVGAGADGTAMALSLASGVVNRSTLVSELNSVPGISNIEFGAQGADSDTAATVSGYLGERLYLSYGVGLYQPINVLTARFYLRTRLWLEVISSLENSVDLYYSFDIN